MTTYSDTFDTRPHTLQLIVTTASQSISGNYSDLSCVLKIVKNPSWDSYSSTSSANSYTATIDGTAVSGNFTFDFRSSTSKTLRTWTKRVYHNGSGEKTASVSASVSAAVIGDAAVSGSYSPADIMQAPSAPTSVTATRVSDASITLAWTRHVSSGAPYTSQTVYVSVDGGAFTAVTSVSSTATSYNYVASGNHKYVFKVRASNSAGSTYSAVSNTILTTPNAIFAVLANSVSPGNILIRLANRPTPYTEANVVIEETHDGGSTWNAKVTLAMSALSTSAATPWLDSSAETTGTTQYQARVVTTGGTQGVLSSGNTLTAALELNTPPLTPTNLTPSGGVDATNAIRLAWEHTPSSDGALQSSRKVEYSTDGGTSWTSIIAGNTAVAYYDWEPTLVDFTAGDTILFRVATAGSQPGTYGAWSVSQTLTLYGSLAVTLVADNPPAVHEGGPLPVAWESSPTWGTASQAQYQVSVRDQDSGLVIYDTGVVTGEATSMNVPSSVQADGRTYTVTVTLLDNHQVTSLPVSADVETDYLEPGPVALEWSYDDEVGTLVLYPTFADDTSSELDDTVAWTLERSLDGETWITVGAANDEIPIGDPLVRVGAASWYRSVGYTSLGVAGEANVVEIPAEDVRSRWGWLNAGDDFSMRVRFGWAQTVSVDAGRASESYELEDADYPSAVFGVPLNETYSVSGKLLSGFGIAESFASSSAAEVLAFAKSAAVSVFRDARGAWFAARVYGVSVAPARHQTDRADEAGLSFTVERIAP